MQNKKYLGALAVILHWLGHPRTIMSLQLTNRL